MRNTINVTHLLSLTKEGDYGIMPPPMDAQVALNELCRYFLGEDWYTVNPVSQEQVNTEIVGAIETLYKGCKIKKPKR